MRTHLHLFKISLILLFIGSSMFLHSQNNNENDNLELGFVTIKTDPTASIYLDDQFKNKGRWYGEILSGQHVIRLEKDGFESVEQHFSLSTGQNLVIEVNGPNKKVIIPIVETEYKQYKYVTLNGSYSIQPQGAIGFTVGYIKKFGAFVSVMTGFGFKGFSADMTADDNGFVNGDYPFYTGKTSKSRLSVIVGGIASIKDKVFIRAGLGYGTRKLAYETEEGKWINHSKYSYNGVDLSLGAQTFFKKFTVSLDVVTTSFKATELKLGFGLKLN